MRLLIYGKVNDETTLIKHILKAIQTWKPKQVNELIVVPTTGIGSLVGKVAERLNINYKESNNPLSLSGIAVILIGENEKLQTQCEQLNIKILKFNAH